MMAADAVYQVEQIGVFTPKKVPVERLGPGEIGFITAQINRSPIPKSATPSPTNARALLRPYQVSSQPNKWCSAACSRSMRRCSRFREALGKLHLNDASFAYETESSAALGFGFRCGFLGLLHLEIVRERLEREFNLDLITTAPA